MKSSIQYLALLLFGLAVSFNAHSAKKADEASEEATIRTAASFVPSVLYEIPVPANPTPKIRVSTGAPRGAEGSSPVITLLTPEHEAFTVLAQPELYWHFSATPEEPVVVTLMEDEGIKPLLELHLEGLETGMHSLRLKDHDISLVTGQRYQWSVRIANTAGEASLADPLAFSFITRKAAPPSLEAAGSQHTLDRIRAFAQNGIWYDSLSELARSLANKPGNQELHTAWSGLLGQIGLEELPVALNF